MLLAEELASESLRDGSLITVFAPECDYFFHALSLGKKFKQEGFRNIRSLLADDRFRNSPDRTVVNLSEGISWVVGSGENTEESDCYPPEKMEMIERLEGNYILSFCGACRFDAVEKIRSCLNVLIVVATSY